MRYRGENGAEWEIDPELMNPMQREAHEAAIAAGRLTPIEQPAPRRTTKKAAATPQPADSDE